MPGPLSLVRRTREALRLHWYRLRLGALGAGCHIETGVSLQYPGRIRLGDGVGIGRNAALRANTDANPGIALGKGVNINDAVVINANRGFVTLGERSWLGPFCLVYGNGGVTIGRNVLVAGHTTINTVSHAAELAYATVDPGDDGDEIVIPLGPPLEELTREIDLTALQDLPDPTATPAIDIDAEADWNKF